MAEQEVNSKYTDIVKTARGLFWKHGVSRVTVEEICREANVSKMTFYRFFPNKVALGKKVIDDIMDENTGKFREIMKEDAPFEEKIKRLLKLKLEGTREISAELVNDIYKNKRLGLHHHWQQRAEEITAEALRSFKEAQEKGAIRKDLKIEFLFYFSTNIAGMLTDKKLLSMFDSVQDLIMELVNLIFYGIFPPGEKER